MQLKSERTFLSKHCNARYFSAEIPKGDIKPADIVNVEQHIDFIYLSLRFITQLSTHKAADNKNIKIMF